VNCYDCHPEVRAAVAVCQLCGKGLCRNHAMRFDRQVHQVDTASLGLRTLPTGRSIPRLLCRECGEGVGVRDNQRTIKVVPE
jgi:hypothetical protein